MNRFYNILDNKITSSIIASILIISAILFKLQYNYHIVLGFIIPIVLIAIGFSFLYTSLVIEKASIRDFVRICIAPFAIFSVVLFIKDANIDKQIIKIALFFFTNILFFNKELKSVIK